jgi:hypothetical protein
MVQRIFGNFWGKFCHISSCRSMISLFLNKNLDRFIAFFLKIAIFKYLVSCIRSSPYSRILKKNYLYICLVATFS